MGKDSVAINRSKILEALKSSYTCIDEPILHADASRSDINGRYLTSLRVFGSREVDEPQSPPHTGKFRYGVLVEDDKFLFASNNFDNPKPKRSSKLTVEQNVIDPQRVKEKVTSALKALSFREPHVLVQFWSPVAVRKRWLLTTLDQPFGLGVVDEGLYLYRLESDKCMFAVDGEHREELGPPGHVTRVYHQKLPEWSLDLNDLSHRQDWAASHNIHGYVTLPVFEPGTGCCVGVLELVTSSTYVDYAFEVRQVSRALKGENLESPNVLEDTSIYARVGDGNRLLEQDEIFQALRMVCDNHHLPLAQTWGPCGVNSVMASSGNLMRSCNSFSRNCIGKVCMSTAALPFSVRDLSKWDFREACRERHLDKSQGVVGRSLSSRGLCFCGDVSQLGEDEYPLAPYARMHGITSCLTFYLKSIEVDDEYVVELFLPTQSENEADLRSLVRTVEQHFKNASRIQVGDMSSIQVIGEIPLNRNLEFSTLTENLHPLSENKNNDCDDAAFSKKQSEFAYVEEDNPTSSAAAGKRREYNIDKSKEAIRKRSRAGDSISLEEIVEHYGKTLEEAANCLGVSRSTLKRICRNLSIPSWSYIRDPNQNDPFLNSDKKDAAIHASDSRHMVKVQTLKQNTKAACGSELDDEPHTEVVGSPVDLSVNQMDLSDLKMVTAMSDTSETDYANVADQLRLTNASIEEICDNFTVEKINLLKEDAECKGDSDTVMSTDTVTVNVKYKESIEQFTFLHSDELSKWEHKVAKRFKIEGQRARLKYKDEDGDLILICYDEDLKAALVTSGVAVIWVRFFEERIEVELVEKMVFGVMAIEGEAGVKDGDSDKKEKAVNVIKELVWGKK
ncbi:hypothetical protein E3N88_45436 [Mikania micrantha]|uniref:PB1 domain-containing protein n=1 Tax=Mikania micrantha TaxID=192012 RepID=A0A5N6L964_9ASTR|nr:hypothetical protein E3N88_45436 [Mikania micrantha]